MLLLASTSDLVQLVYSAATGVALDCHTSYVDNNAGTITPGRTNQAQMTNTAGATVTIVGSPGSSVSRNVQAIVIHNANATYSNAITIQHTDGTNVAVICTYTIQPGETLYFTEMGQCIVIDASGGLKTNPESGRLLKISYLTSTSTATFTTGPATNTLRIRMWGGGGAGGGGASTTSDAAVGGGAAAGGYAEWYVAA